MKRSSFAAWFFLGVVFQGFARYDLSAQENIGIGNIDHVHGQDRVYQVARRLGIDDLITGLPQGYQTVLSRWLAEDGIGADLSGENGRRWRSPAWPCWRTYRSPNTARMPSCLR